MLTKSIPVLNDENYLQWRERMKAFLTTRRLWEAVRGFRDEDGELIPEADWSETQRNKDEEAQIVLLQGVEDQFVGDIKNEVTAGGRWKALETLHCDYSSVDVATLFGEMYVVRKESTMTMRQYISKLEGIMDKISEAGVRLPDDVKAALLLPGLPRKKYESLINQFRVEDKTLTFLNVKSRLIKFGKQEEISKARTQQEEASAQLVRSEQQPLARKKTEDRSPRRFESSSGSSFRTPLKCFRCGEIGHGVRECRNELKCFKCKKSGHISTKCPEGEPSKESASAKIVSGQENILQDTVKKAQCMVMNAEVRREAKYLDSCASHHMCPFKEWFVDLGPSAVKEVNQGDSTGLKVEGEGKVVIKMASGWDITFENVLYVPRLGSTLISVGVLTKRGFRLAFAGDEGLVLSRDGKEVMFKAISVGGIYRIQTVEGHGDFEEETANGAVFRVESEVNL